MRVVASRCNFLLASGQTLVVCILIMRLVLLSAGSRLDTDRTPSRNPYRQYTNPVRWVGPIVKPDIPSYSVLGTTKIPKY